jgi:replication-associated recombination protein RarA
MFARIYKPARNAMQSGNAAGERWILEFEPELKKSADPLMGYTSSADMRRQIRLAFDEVKQAVAYAEKHGIPYRVAEAQEPSAKKMSYSDNFRYGRPQPWTH